MSQRQRGNEISEDSADPGLAMQRPLQATNAVPRVPLECPQVRRHREEQGSNNRSTAQGSVMYDAIQGKGCVAREVKRQRRR